MSKPTPKSTVVIPRLSDEALAAFMVVDVKYIPRLDPAKRRAYEALADAERRIKLWQAGEGPKPHDILMD